MDGTGLCSCEGRSPCRKGTAAGPWLGAGPRGSTDSISRGSALAEICSLLTEEKGLRRFRLIGAGLPSGGAGW